MEEKDDLGVTIKTAPKAEVDDLGIPVKKKDEPTSKSPEVSGSVSAPVVEHSQESISAVKLPKEYDVADVSSYKRLEKGKRYIMPKVSGKMQVEGEWNGEKFTNQQPYFEPITLNDESKVAITPQDVTAPKPKPVVTPLAEKLKGKTAAQYAGEKGRDIFSHAAVSVEEKNKIQHLDKFPKWEEFNQVNSAIQTAVAEDNKEVLPDLVAKRDEILKSPIREGYSTATGNLVPQDESSDANKNKQIIADAMGQHHLDESMKDVVTVEDALKYHNEAAKKFTQSTDKIQAAHKDIQEVQSPLLKNEGDKLNEDGAIEVNAFSALGNSFVNSLHSVTKGIDFLSQSPEQRANMMDEDIGKQVLYPEKLSHIGEGFQMIGGMLPYFIPTAGLEMVGVKGAAALIGGTTITSMMMGSSAGYDAALETYQEELNKTGDRNHAVEQATQMYRKMGAVGTTVGAALPLAGLAGNKLSARLLGKDLGMEIEANGYKNVNAIDYMVHNGLHNIPQTMLFSAQNIAKNVIGGAQGLDKKAADNLIGTAVSAFVAGYLMNQLTFGWGKMKAATQELYTDTAAKYYPEQTIISITKATTEKSINPQTANEIIKEIKQRSQAFKDVEHLNLSAEQEHKVVPKLVEINQLVDQNKDANIAVKSVNETKVEELVKQVHEILGTSLSKKEQKEYDKLKSIAKDAEDKLDPNERQKLKHYEKRIAAEEEWEGKKDKRIEKIQRKNDLPTEPEVVLSDEGNRILKQIQDTKHASNEEIKTLSDELYKAHQALFKTRDNSNRRFTKAQIDAKIEGIGEMVDSLESALTEQGNSDKSVEINLSISRQQTPAAAETKAEKADEVLHTTPAGVSVKVDNAPEGNHLNIGMKVGRGDEMLTQEQILSKLPEGVTAESVSVVEGTEPTLSIKTSRKLTDAEMAKLMEDTQQQAIPQLTDGVGVLHDAKKGTSEGWGDFNPDYFVTQDGKKLSEAAPLTPKQKALKEIADAEAKASAPKEYTVDNIKDADTEDLSATGVKVVEDMKRVLPAIGRIVKEGTGNEVKLVVHNNPESFEKAVLNANGSKQDAASSGGFWMSKTGEIHLDINAVDSETGLHEGFHSILDHIEANNPEAIDKLFTQLEGVEGAEDIVAAAKKNYDGDVTQKKEAITDFIAKVADGQIKVDATNIEKVKHFINQALRTVGLDKLAEKFATDLGLDMSEAKDLQELAKSITGKFKKGEGINPSEFGKDGKIVSDKPQFMSFGGYEKNGYEETKEYKDLVKSGHIVESYNIAGIGGRRVYITSPDNMMVGNVTSGGNSLLTGEGGVHFVSKTGHVWAFKASGEPMVKFINAEIKANGVANIVLTKGKLGKTLNTHDGAIGAMHVLEDLMNRGHIGTSVFRKALLVVGKKYRIDFYGTGDTESIQRSLKKGFYGKENSTFENRGNFIGDFVAQITQGARGDSRTDVEAIKKALNTDRTLGKDVMLNKDNVKAALGGLFADEMTLDAKIGEAYAVIEVKSPVKSVNIDKEEGGHGAYPNHIVTEDGSRPKLLILDKPRYIGDVANDESNKPVATKLDVTGKPKYPHQQLGSANTGFARGVMKSTNEIEQNKPQFSKSDKVKGTYYEPHLTESKDKKDYVFFHVSGADKKSLEKGIDSRKFNSTRTSRDEKGLQYGVASYYTKPTDGERMVGGDKYAVHVPKDKVYPMDTDPNGYREAAEKKVKEGTPFREEKIKKEIAASAKGDGFMIAVGEWGHDRTGGETETPAMRADALVPLKPEKEMASEYKPATTKEIPHPDKEAIIAQNKLADFAQAVSDHKSSKGTFDDAYSMAEQIRIYGGIKEGDGVRPPTPAEFKEMTKGLPRDLAKQAKEIQFSKSSGNKKVERHFDKYVEVAKEGIKEDPNYSIEDLAKDTGHDVKDLQKVWDEANGKEEVKTVGVSHDSMVANAEKMGVAEPERGQVLSPEQLVNRGRELLREGADVEELEANFKHDKTTSSDGIALARAHFEELTRLATKAYEEFGESSKEYQEAKIEMARWRDEVVKPMGTAAGEQFRALQGETELDTGSFVQLQTAAESQGGKPLTPQQTKEAKELSSKVTVLNKEVERLKKKLTETIDNSVQAQEKEAKKTYTQKAKSVADEFRKLKGKPLTFKGADGKDITVHKMDLWDDGIEFGAQIIEAGGRVADAVSVVVDKIKEEDWYKNLSRADQDALHTHIEGLLGEKKPLEERFVDKEDNAFDMEDVRDIWNHAKKEYLDKGADYSDMLRGVSVDLGLTTAQVRHAISQPKGARVITDEMYRMQRNRNKAISEAKRWVQTTNEPKVSKFLSTIPSAFFQLKTFGHGTVGGVTHAGMQIFKPSEWKSYFPFFAKQFKYSFGGLTKEGLANYEKAMEDLTNDPTFTMWQRAGLAVDPKKSYDDYQVFGGFFDKAADIGNRGFNALKVLRLDLAKTHYDRLSAAEKADPEVAKSIAQFVNHATGTSDVTPPKWAQAAFFAPKLEASRWARWLKEPAQAANAFANWGKATNAEKARAKMVAKGAAEMLVTYSAMLAANAGILAATGSKQQVNFTDPEKHDFMQFKVGGHDVNVTGGMLSLFHFVGNLLKIGLNSQKNVGRDGNNRYDAYVKAIAKYGRGKLSPFAATAADWLSRRDYGMNVLPPFDDKPAKFAKKLSWSEYLLQSQTPIPVAVAVKDMEDVMKQRGMSEKDIKTILDGIFVGTVVGTIGAHVGVDYGENDKK